jgi:hypothetical protein
MVSAMNDRRMVVFTGLVLFMALVSVEPLLADFDAVVRAFESRYGVRQTWIPFFGLARLAIRVAHPQGVTDLQLATFDHARFGEARDIEALVRQYAGEGFSPLVQVHSTRSGECTLIYARPAGGDRVALLIFAHDRGATTLLNVTVSTDRLGEAMAHPGSMKGGIR